MKDNHFEKNFLKKSYAKVYANFTSYVSNFGGGRQVPPCPRDCSPRLTPSLPIFVSFTFGKSPRRIRIFDITTYVCIDFGKYKWNIITETNFTSPNGLYRGWTALINICKRDLNKFVFSSLKNWKGFRIILLNSPSNCSIFSSILNLLV